MYKLILFTFYLYLALKCATSNRQTAEIFVTQSHACSLQKKIHCKGSNESWGGVKMRGGASVHKLAYRPFLFIELC